MKKRWSESCVWSCVLYIQEGINTTAAQLAVGLNREDGRSHSLQYDLYSVYQKLFIYESINTQFLTIIYFVAESETTHSTHTQPVDILLRIELFPWRVLFVARVWLVRRWGEYTPHLAPAAVWSHCLHNKPEPDTRQHTHTVASRCTAYT